MRARGGCETACGCYVSALGCQVMHHACDRLSWQRFGARFARAGRDEFETRLAQTGGLGALQLLDGVVQTPRWLETSAPRETLSQKSQEAERANCCVDPSPDRTAHFLLRDVAQASRTTSCARREFVKRAHHQ